MVYYFQVYFYLHSTLIPHQYRLIQNHTDCPLLFDLFEQFSHFLHFIVEKGMNYKELLLCIIIHLELAIIFLLDHFIQYFLFTHYSDEKLMT